MFALFISLLITSLITSILPMYHLPVAVLKDKLSPQANVFPVSISKALSRAGGTSSGITAVLS